MRKHTWLILFLAIGLFNSITWSVFECSVCSQLLNSYILALKCADPNEITSTVYTASYRYGVSGREPACCLWMDSLLSLNRKRNRERGSTWRCFGLNVKILKGRQFPHSSFFQSQPLNSVKGPSGDVGLDEEGQG